MGNAHAIGRTGLSPLQWAALIGSAAVLLWSVPGLIINPDFSTGPGSSERVLGVDMNGWHAVSGFFVAVPCLALLAHTDLLAVIVPASAVGLIATGIWALADTQVAGGLFDFPHNETDAVLHFAVSAVFIAGAAWHFAARPRAAA